MRITDRSFASLQVFKFKYIVLLSKAAQMARAEVTLSLSALVMVIGGLIAAR